MSDIGSSPQPSCGTNRLAGLTSFVPEINSPLKLAAEAGWLTWEGVPRGTALAGGTGGRGLSKLSLAALRKCWCLSRYLAHLSTYLAWPLQASVRITPPVVF